MTRLVLDTSAYSHFRRGAGPAVSLITAASWIGMTATVLGELRAGFGRGTRRARNEHDLAAFLSRLIGARGAGQAVAGWCGAMAASPAVGSTRARSIGANAAR